MISNLGGAMLDSFAPIPLYRVSPLSILDTQLSLAPPNRRRFSLLPERNLVLEPALWPSRGVTHYMLVGVDIHQIVPKQ